MATTAVASLLSSNATIITPAVTAAVVTTTTASTTPSTVLSTLLLSTISSVLSTSSSSSSSTTTSTSTTTTTTTKTTTAAGIVATTKATTLPFLLTSTTTLKTTQAALSKNPSERTVVTTSSTPPPALRSIAFDNFTTHAFNFTSRSRSRSGSITRPTPKWRSSSYRTVGLGPVILDILITLFLTTFITGIVMNTFLVIALMRRKRPSTPADLVVSNMHFCLYYLFLDSLVLFNELFVTPKPSVDFNVFYVSNPFTNCAMPYLFAVFHMGFFGCIAVVSAITFVTVVHPSYNRIASMRNVAMALIFIWTFCILSNVHFLLAHCDRFDYEYFIEYVKNVWIKFLIVDGAAVLMSLVLLLRTVAHLMQSDSPDRLLLRTEAVGYLLILLAYTMPLLVDAFCALAEDRMTLTSHRILTVAVREISYCTIPAVLARFRPLSRSDCHNLLDSIRSCCSRNFSRLSAASSRQLGGVRWSAASTGSHYFLAATNPNSGLNTSDSNNNGFPIGRSNRSSRRIEDDQVQILSICQDSQGAFEDGL